MFRSNRTLLQAHGVDYPDQFGPEDDKHTFLVTALRNDRELKTLRKLLSGVAFKTCLLSNEGLSNHFDDMAPDALKTFRTITAEVEVILILVARSWEDWLRSYYRQCVLNPNNGSSDIWGTSLTLDQIRSHPRIRRFKEPESLLLDMKRGFGACEAHLVNFDAPDWAEHVTHLLGLAPETLGSPPMLNTSLPDWCIEVLRQFNALDLSDTERRRWQSRLRHFTAACDSRSKLERNAVTTRQCVDRIETLDHSLLKSCDAFLAFKENLYAQLGKD